MLSEEDENYVIRLADQLDKDIQEMAASLHLAQMDAVILTSFNMADKLRKAQDNVDHMRDQIKGHLDEIQKLKADLAESRREISRLRVK